MAIVAKQGKNQVLLWRLLEESSTKVAAKLAFQEEHSKEGSVEGGDTKVTKDGPIAGEGTITEEVPFTSTMGKGDPTAEMLENAFYSQKLLELWEVDVTEKDDSGKYPAEYRQGRLNSLTISASVEDTVMLEGTFITNGTRQKGNVTLSLDQEEAIQYAFRDTQKVTGIEG